MTEPVPGLRDFEAQEWVSIRKCAIDCIETEFMLYGLLGGFNECGGKMGPSERQEKWLKQTNATWNQGRENFLFESPVTR
jgi:hypothetical protein